jgi:hypothetical protein
LKQKKKIEKHENTESNSEHVESSYQSPPPLPTFQSTPNVAKKEIPVKSKTPQKISEPTINDAVSVISEVIKSLEGDGLTVKQRMQKLREMNKAKRKQK